MSCAGCGADWHRQAGGVDDRVNLAVEPASRPAHVFLSVRRDRGSVLVYTPHRGIDHLHRRVMAGGQRIHDAVPDACLPPTNEAIITSGAGTIGFRQIAPGST